MGTQMPIIITVVINTNNKFGIKMLPRNIEISSVHKGLVFVLKNFSFTKEKIESIVMKLKRKQLDFTDEKKVVWTICSTPVEICWEDISIKKSNGMIEIFIGVKHIDLNQIFNNIIKKIENEVALDILNVISEKSEEKSKFELVKCLVDWMQKYHIPNHIMTRLASKNDKMKKYIDKYELEIRDIKLECWKNGSEV